MYDQQIALLFQIPHVVFVVLQRRHAALLLVGVVRHVVGVVHQEAVLVDHEQCVRLQGAAEVFEGENVRIARARIEHEKLFSQHVAENLSCAADSVEEGSPEERQEKKRLELWLQL